HTPVANGRMSPRLEPRPNDLIESVNIMSPLSSFVELSSVGLANELMFVRGGPRCPAAGEAAAPPHPPDTGTSRARGLFKLPLEGDLLLAAEDRGAAAIAAPTDDLLIPFCRADHVRKTTIAIVAQELADTVRKVRRRVQGDSSGKYVPGLGAAVRHVKIWTVARIGIQQQRHAALEVDAVVQECYISPDPKGSDIVAGYPNTEVHGRVAAGVNIRLHVRVGVGREESVLQPDARLSVKTCVCDNLERPKLDHGDVHRRGTEVVLIARRIVGIRLYADAVWRAPFVHL